jgi:signal peptidase II
MHALRRWALVLAGVVTLVGCDHATKYAAKAELEGQPPRVLIASVLDLRYTENTDVAFSLLRWIPEGVRAPLLVVFGAVATVALIVLLRRSTTWLARAGVAFLLAGALGNYLDRLFRGYVVDFIHVHHWPVFNVADICVAIGIALFYWTSRPRSAAVPSPAAGAT